MSRLGAADSRLESAAILGSLLVAALAVGYQGGSVLAGKAVEPIWLVFVLAPLTATVVLVARRSAE